MIQFDNRSDLRRFGLRWMEHLSAFRADAGELHFQILLQDRKIGYCYIRKNGCSNFKQMLLDLAPASYVAGDWQRPIDFLIAHSRLAPADGCDCDRTIFVYRDPVDRLVSLFKNKFVARSGNAELFDSFERRCGCPPEQATFRTFINDYLTQDFARLDKHVLPQARHLGPLAYTDAIRIDELSRRMQYIVGPELAKKYFARPRNATSDRPSVAIPGSADASAQELHRRYQEAGTQPTAESLLDGELVKVIRTIYIEDMEMMDRISAAGRSDKLTACQP